LIYLVLTPQQAHTREHLATLLWPDEPEAVAKKNLRQSLYRLRQLLGNHDSENQTLRQAQGKQFFLATRITIQFNPADHYRLDTADFLSALNDEDLETAVSLYQGDLLPGFNCQSQPFDDWLRQERERYHQLAMNAFHQLTRDSLNQADFQRAQTFARRQLALEPWREEAHRQLMQALSALGERTAALAQYETCRAVLAEEFGAEPMAETAALAERIRADQIQRPLPQPLPNRSGRQRLTIPFVGRQPEYETLVNAYWQMSHDGLQVVTVQGYAGMGKTRLTEQFVSWAATQGADVLVGRSYETSAGLSYQPLILLLRQRLERENAPEDLLSDLWLSQLTRLLPELRERYPDLPPPTKEENTARQHLFEAIARLGQALAALRPLVLLIDDWHWADSASLDMLQYATQRWAEEKVPILLLLTLRQEALTDSADLQSWLAQLKRSSSAQQLDLSALSPTETARLVETLFSPDAGNGDGPSTLTQFSDWLFKETAGQPLFLTEALKILAEDGVIRSEQAPLASSGQAPSSGQVAWQLDWSRFDRQRASSTLLKGMREIVQGWLARISAPAAELLRATAVLAQEASFDHLCLVTELDERQTVSALDELLKHQLLLETEERQAWVPDPVYTFSHHKVSEVVYAEAGRARRRLLHRRAFEVLQPSVPTSDLAHHALQAGLLTETIRYSLMAGNEAMNLFAHQVAIAHYQTVQQVVEQEAWPEAVSGADRQAFYSRLGRAYELTDAWPKAQKLYEIMIADAQKIGAAAMECQGLNHLATVHINGKLDHQQATAVLEKARTVAERHGDQRGLAETELNAARAAAFNDSPKRAITHGEIALSLARELGHPQLLASCLAMLSMINYQLRRWPMAEINATEARQIYAAADNQVLAADSQRLLGISQLYNGYPQKMVVGLQKTFEFYQQIENLWGEAETARMLAQGHIELGHYGRAIRLARQGVEQARKMDVDAMVYIALAAWATVHRTLMALDVAREALLEVLMVDSQQVLIGFIKDWVLSELCATHAIAGKWDQAASYAKQRLQSRKDKSLLSMGLTGWYETKALLQGGDEELARTEVACLGEIVGENKRYQLPLLRSRAVLARWDGDVGLAIDHLAGALALAREMGLPGEEWSILGELGELYGALGEEVKAREVYGEAGVIIHRLADTIDDEGLREGFLTAVSIQTILNNAN
jgi:DNA-binding SARP family transcriptional activator